MQGLGQFWKYFKKYDLHTRVYLSILFSINLKGESDLSLVEFTMIENYDFIIFKFASQTKSNCSSYKDSRFIRRLFDN